MAQGATAAGVAQLLAYYNTIQSVRAEGGSRVDAWAAIQGIEGEGGPTTHGSTIFDMNEVWQRAGAVLSAQAGYAQNLEDGALTGDGWAWAPWASQTTADWQQANFQIRYQYEVVSPGGDVSTFWGQTDWQGFTGGMPSIDDIQTRVNTSAQTAFDRYPAAFQQSRGIETGSSLGDIVAVQLLRV